MTGGVSRKSIVRGPIFIIGCARSGTTWLGTIFARSEGFHATIEDPYIFPLVDDVVLDWRRRVGLLELLIPLYREQIVKAGARLYVDKSHQNIWLVEDLVSAFPSARFVAIERSAYAVIASMMRHAGARQHFANWRRYSVPNPHLGIGPADALGYDDLPLSIKCALRWRSHHERLKGLRRTLGDQLHLIRYEALVEKTDVAVADLARFIGEPLRPAVPSCGTLEKWHHVLSRRQTHEIDRVLGEELEAGP